MKIDFAFRNTCKHIHNVLNFKRDVYLCMVWSEDAHYTTCTNVIECRADYKTDIPERIHCSYWKLLANIESGVCVCVSIWIQHTHTHEKRDRKRDFPFSGQWILNLCFCLWIRSISSSYTEHSKPNSIEKRWRIFCFRNMNEWIFKLSIHCQRVFSCSDFRSSHIIKAFTERVHLHSGISLPSSNSVNFGWKYSDIQFA